MGKCKCCNRGELVFGHDVVKSQGKKYDLYVCTNCDKSEYVEIVDKSKK